MRPPKPDPNAPTESDALQAADRSGGLLEAVFNNATVALFVMDERQQCIYMNPAAELLTGYTLPEVQGRPLHDVIHHTKPDGSHYPIEECPIDRAYPENNQEQGEDLFIHKNGDFFPVAYTASPLRHGDRVIGTIIEVIDITERKRTQAALEEQAQTLRAINRIGAALAAELNLDRLVQTVTDAGRELSGAAYGAFFYNSRRNDHDFDLYTLSGADAHAFQTHLVARSTALLERTYRGEGPVRIDDLTREAHHPMDGPHRDGPPGILDVRSYLAVPVVSRDDTVIGGLLYGHPDPAVFTQAAEDAVVTLANQAAVAIDNARLYEQAQRIAGTLETKVAERTAELQAATQELESFNYSVSHDLRAPLRGINGFSRVLLDDYAHTLDEDARRYLERIVSGAERMGDLIDALLDLSRLVRTPLQPRPVDLADITREILADLRDRDPGRTVTVELDDDLTTRGDPKLLRAALENMLGNAWKFTRHAPRPRIEVRKLERDGYPTFVIRDNGVGFEMAYADKLFQPFQRLHNVHEFEGTGIGLATVQRIIQKHGGRIWAESSVGAGSAFYFTLFDDA